MKVLIAGGAGEVGKYLANYLLGCGHEIRVLDLPTKAPEMERDSRITFIPGEWISLSIWPGAFRMIRESSLGKI